MVERSELTHVQEENTSHLMNRIAFMANCGLWNVVQDFYQRYLNFASQQEPNARNLFTASFGIITPNNYFNFALPRFPVLQLSALEENDPTGIDSLFSLDPRELSQANLFMAFDGPFEKNHYGISFVLRKADILLSSLAAGKEFAVKTKGRQFLSISADLGELSDRIISNGLDEALWMRESKV